MIAKHRYQLVFLFLLFTVFLKPFAAFAQEKVYVTDVLLINFRTGPGNDYRIEKRLKSGTALQRVGQNEEGSWSKVIAPDGTEGYVLSQYIGLEPTAQIKLVQTLSKLSTLENRLAQLEEKNKSLENENNKLNQLANSSKNNSDKLGIELRKIKSLSANAIDLDQRHQSLLEKHQMIQTERDTLRAENENLKSDKRLSFLIYGAGLLILGMLIAIILPSLRFKKRNSEWA